MVRGRERDMEAYLYCTTLFFLKSFIKSSSLPRKRESSFWAFYGFLLPDLIEDKLRKTFPEILFIKLHSAGIDGWEIWSSIKSFIVCALKQAVLPSCIS